MSSAPTRSTSSADLPPGTLIAGFRLERVVGRGSRATVYEATQLALDRRVAFKLMRDRELAERVRRLEWPEHPGAVSLFGAGDSPHGPWLAMRLVPGGATLATAPAPLDQVAAALAEAHAAGLLHGAVTARNVLVEGDRAYLSDFGLAPGAPTAEEDRAALARLVRDHPPPRASAQRRASRRRAAVIAAAAAALVAVVGVVVGVVVAARDGNSANPGDAPPPLAAGARAIGSDLAAGDLESVDCDGSPPSGTSRACTVSQLALGGRETVIPIDGTITSWAVRGARGDVGLQVLRERGGRFVAIDGTGDATVPGPGLHVVRTSLAVAAGDRVALAVAPGAAVGVRRGTRASTERWFGPLRDIPSPPDRAAGTGFDHELLLRVEVSPEAGVATVEPLRGDAAATALPGRVLATRDVDVGGGELRTVRLAAFGSGVAVDLFDGARRLARAPVAGADGRGQLRGLAAGTGSVRVRWRNPDGERIDRTIAVTADRLG